MYGKNLQKWRCTLKKELLLTIGHSIVYEAEERRWTPSGLYQPIITPKSPDDRIVRTHMSIPHMTGNEPFAYLGGGQIVLRALSCLNATTSNAEIAIIGGRPQSMDDQFRPEIIDGVTEASVMAEYFNMVSARKPKFVVGGTKTTQDDMRAMLDLALLYSTTTVVVMDFRIERCRLHMLDTMYQFPQYAGLERTIEFMAAEDLLPHLRGAFHEMKKSAAFTRTMVQENFGIAKLKENLGFKHELNGIKF